MIYQKLKSSLNLSDNNILTGTIIVTIGAFIANIFSYLLQIVLSRLLTVAEYGEFNSLLSLSLVLTIPTVAFDNSLIKLVSDLKGTLQFNVLSKIFFRLLGYTLFLALIAFSIMFVLTPFLADFLHIKNDNVFFMFSLFLSLSLFAVIPRSYLRGLARFKAFAFYTAISSIVRFTFPIVFIYLGFRVGGIFIGFLTASVVSFCIGLLLLKKNLHKYSTEEVKKYYSILLSFSMVTLLVALGMNFLNNLDVILVKHYFSPESAGIYSSIVTVGKVVLFGTGTVTILMYPDIASLHAAGQDYSDRLRKYLVLQLVFIAGSVFVFYVFPELIVQILFGEKFLSAVPYVPLYSIFVSVYVLINFMIMFLLAIDKKIAFLFPLLGALLQVILINVFHNSLTQVIWVNIVTVIIVLILTIVYSFSVKKHDFNSNPGL